MIHYIIENITKWKKKDGTMAEMTSYFQRHLNVVYPMNSMTGNQEEAKKYDCKSEAKRDIAKYFHGRDCKVLKIVTND